MSRLRVLTGITPSGSPHLGNYVGAIRPAVRASQGDAECYYFLADYHSLIKNHDPVRLQRSTLEIAASWLACGLSTEHAAFYRQSDVAEIPELTWFLTCVTGKGLLNRAHAYKASVDKNNAAGLDPDADVSAGLFMYPVLMAADILIFNANRVPVGRDQIQHIEMARDIASSFNHLYGELFTLPEAAIDDNVATLPGLDGRKMSKSYDNTIPLFTPRAQLQKLINGIKTDSTPPGAPKSTEGSALFELYQAFASDEETAQLRQAFADGIAWGDAKQALFERVDREVAPMRERYDELMADPAQVEAVLQQGAAKVRPMAQALIARAREAVGIKSLSVAVQEKAAAKKASKAGFKQYRDEDGQFRFKFVAGNGEVLLQSLAFASPKEAGALVGQLRDGGMAAVEAARQQLEPIAENQREALAAALHELQTACAPIINKPGTETMNKTSDSPSTISASLNARPEDMKVIYVVDDHPMMREAIAAMLRRQFAATRVIEFSSLAEAKAGSAAFPNPDVVCLDLTLGDSQGPRGVSEIKALHPYVPLVVISGHAASEMEEACLQAGADVYIEKSAGAADIRATLRALIAPESEFDESEMFGAIKLSKRQKQLIAMLDYGFSNREIATELGLSEHTVKVHLLRLFRRLNVNSRTQALHVARLNGLLS